MNRLHTGLALIITLEILAFIDNLEKRGPHSLLSQQRAKACYKVSVLF
jgi:hypothetical protein